MLTVKSFVLKKELLVQNLTHLQGMSSGKVSMTAGGGVKQNASLEQSVQVSTATQRAATTTRQSHTEKLTKAS